VLELRSHVPAESADPIVERLSRTPGLSHLTLIPLATTSSVVIQAELDPVHADAILAELEAMGLTGESTLIRHATIPIGEQAGRPDDSFIWTDLVAEARVSSRAAPRYLALMAVAGIIAAMGILDSNTTLIVGAMAVAPDLLPIVAACVGLAGRRSRLFARGFLSLAAGMAMASFAAGTVTVALIAIGWSERSIVPEVTFIGPAGRIEGRFQPSKVRGAPIAIVLHPHPQFGGTMNNPLVYDLFQMFHEIGRAHV